MTKLATLTFEETKALIEKKAVVLVPVGSVEPHGPHLPLATDAYISENACARAVVLLEKKGTIAAIAPTVPYGVTDYAGGFAGAIGVSADVLTAFLRDLVKRFLTDGFTHVCLVNNHLEPAHDKAVRAAILG